MKQISKRELKKQLNRERMINAAVRLFSTRPFSKVSIREIAKLADVSPGLIYKYFDDQQDLFMEALKVESRGLVEFLSCEDDIDQIAKKYINYMFEHETLYQMMAYFMLEMNTPKSTMEKLRKLIAPLLQLFEQNLRKYNMNDTKTQAQLFFSTLNGLLITYKNLPGRTKEKNLSHIHHLAQLFVQQCKTARN